VYVLSSSTRRIDSVELSALCLTTDKQQMIVLSRGHRIAKTTIQRFEVVLIDMNNY